MCGRVLVAVCAGAVTAAGCALGPPSSAVLESRVLDLTLEANGSLLVRDQFVVRFVGSPEASFSLTVPDDRVDTFADVEASIAGPAGEAIGRASVETSGPLVVRWTFEEVTDAALTFRVTYRADGVLGVSGSQATLAWPVAPLVPPWPVVQQSVALHLPGTARVLRAPFIDGTGWLQHDGEEFRAEASGLGPEESATLRATLSAGAFDIAEPRWQYERARALQMMPAFVSGGLFILVIGIGAAIMLRVQYPDLSRLVREPAPADAAAIDASLAEVLLTRQMRNRTRQAGAFSALQEAGLIEPERQEVVEGTRSAALVTIAFGAVCAAAAWFVMARFGLWPLAVPAGFVLSGLLLFRAARQLSILSVRGEEARQALLAREPDGPTRR